MYPLFSIGRTVALFGQCFRRGILTTPLRSRNRRVQRHVFLFFLLLEVLCLEHTHLDELLLQVAKLSTGEHDGDFGI